MIPAQQGFKTNGTLGLQINLGLVIYLELILGQCLAQGIFHRQALKGRGTHGVRVELVVVPAFLLGVKHCRIGILHKVFDTIAIIGKNRNPDTRRDHDLFVTE